MPPGDVGYWQSIEEMQQQTLAFVGDRKFFRGNHTGVYKNFVYGYGRPAQGGPIQLPAGWKATRSEQVGSIGFLYIDLSQENAVDNPPLGFFAVLGTLLPQDDSLPTTAFWEVIPDGPDRNLDWVRGCVTRNNPATAGGAHWVDYTLCLSEDRLTLNRNYGNHAPHFLAINGSRQALAESHIDLDSPGSTAQIPLLEARQVDEQFRFTGVSYAFSAGDGQLLVDNPHLGQRLFIDARDPLAPRRRLTASRGARPSTTEAGLETPRRKVAHGAADCQCRDRRLQRSSAELLGTVLAE
jgi:hypothetical protein